MMMITPYENNYYIARVCRHAQENNRFNFGNQCVKRRKGIKKETEGGEKENTETKNATQFNIMHNIPEIVQPDHNCNLCQPGTPISPWYQQRLCKMFVVS